uniref:TIR domain-containing protein n=1 Tax=Esox lucius TaxID=8010 RepID=A0AAY5KKE7_ESOLU
LSPGVSIMPELGSWSAQSQIRFSLCFLLCCRFFVNRVNSYVLTNCTIENTRNITINMKVLCSQRNLESIPNDIPSKVRFLDISYNYISKIKIFDLKFLTTLKVLNMCSNIISHIDDGAFSDLVALQVLNLDKNKLTCLSGHMFQGLGNLLVLTLSENYITTITRSSVQSLYSLKEAVLKINRLRDIEHVTPIFHLPNLQTLDISDNLFDSFQSSKISKSTSVRRLDVSYNTLKIFSITDNVFPDLQTLHLSYCGPHENGSMDWDVPDSHFLRNVSDLHLSHIHMSAEMMSMLLRSLNSSLVNLTLNNQVEYKLKTLVDEACHIPTLRTVHLKENNISKDMLQSCTQVTEMDLSGSDTIELSELFFRSMKYLRILSLQSNKLLFIPNVLKNLATLEVLDLSGNMISRLDCLDLDNLTRLTELYLEINDISIIEECFFQDMGALKILDLHDNKILTLNGAFKKGLVNLESLNLKHNYLRSIEGEFENLPSLKHLDLSFNDIYLMERAFKGLATLTTLDLSSCRLHYLGKSLTALNALKTLNVSHNSMVFENYRENNIQINPPFSNLSSLEHLVMDYQSTSYLPSDYLQGLKSLLTLSAQNFHFNYLDPETFAHTPNLISLDISKNDLSKNDLEHSLKLFKLIPNLEKLYMSECGLPSLDFIFLVERNIFKKDNEVSLSSLPALTFLDVQGNPFSCDCSNAFFIQWVKSNSQTQVVEAYQYLCKYPKDLKGSKLLDLDTRPCFVDSGFFYYISTASLVILTLLGAFIYHLLRWQVVYAYYLFQAYLYDAKRKKHCVPYQFDAFISYNAHDEPWVKGELLPELEEGQGWKLCLHHRDFQPGKSIIDNITDAIYGSRKTISVISHRYLESEWCSREIQMPSFRLFDEQKDVLILVFLEEIPDQQLSPYHRMRRLVKKSTYLSWPKAGDHTGVFWHKLRMALETKDCPAEENPILTGVEMP